VGGTVVVDVVEGTVEVVTMLEVVEGCVGETLVEDVGEFADGLAHPAKIKASDITINPSAPTNRGLWRCDRLATDEGTRVGT